MMTNSSFIHKLRSFHFHKNSSQEKCLQIDDFNIGKLWYISISILAIYSQSTGQSTEQLPGGPI